MNKTQTVQTERKMHTLALRKGEALDRYLDGHAGFRQKTDLMLAALEHFQKCPHSVLRNVSWDEKDRAVVFTEEWLESDEPTYDVDSFVKLIDYISIACRTHHKTGDVDLVVRVARRLGVAIPLAGRNAP